MEKNKTKEKSAEQTQLKEEERISNIEAGVILDEGAYNFRD